MAVSKPSKRGKGRQRQVHPAEANAAQADVRYGPVGARAEAARRAQVRRDVLALLVNGADEWQIADALEKERGVVLDAVQVRAVIAEARTWQRERAAQRRQTARADVEEQVEALVRTTTGSAKVAALKLKAAVLGVEAPVEVRVTHDAAPDVLAALGQASQDELARAVQRGLRQRGD